ncbi:unnamed protein product [Closterium sp. NIES-53]
MEPDVSAPAGMFTVQQTPSTVLCCLCGTAMPPNPTGMCPGCIRTHVDITEGLPRRLSVLRCPPPCGRFLAPPRAWIRAELESKELLTFCLKRMKNLNKVKLVDASFIWTEPHSKRIKIKVTIQKEVLSGAVLQQTFVTEYVVEDHMCDACTRSAANPDQWVAVVQLRQKAEHKRTFLFLEQLILKHGADANTINIRQVHDGIDFYYANRSHAQKFVDFVSAVVPAQHRSDKQLVSHDIHTASYNYKYTFSVEICPVCKEDLICLPPKAANACGTAANPLVLCIRVSNSLQLLDPSTLHAIYIDSNQYWRYGFKPLLSSRQLVEYVVLDVETVGGGGGWGGGGGGGVGGAPHKAGGGALGKFVLADVQVARVADFGKNDVMFTARTHLGHLLRPGDYAMGYDLHGANLNSDDLARYSNRATLPDVILVRKSYEEKRKKRRGKPRAWKLKQLDMEVDGGAGGAAERGERGGGGGGGAKGRIDEERDAVDKERFLEELEEDADMRSRIAVYRDPAYVAPPAGGVRGGDEMVDAGEEEEEEEDGEEVPEIPLEELLSDLRIAGEEAEEGEPARCTALPCPAAHTPCSPRTARPAQPCSPRAALPCNPRAALPCSPRVALWQPARRPFAALLALLCLRRPAAAATAARATNAAGAGAARGGQRRSLPLPDDPTPQQLREWVLQRARPGGGGFGFLRTAQSRQQSQQETFSPQVLSELFPQRCVTGSVEAAALGASESAAALGASESAAALGARESAVALGARVSPATVARASTVLPCPTVPSGSLSGLHLPTFSTNLVSNAVIQDVWIRWLRRVRCLRLVSLQRLARVGYSPTRLSTGTTASVTPPYHSLPSFSSYLLAEFCRDEGIVQLFMLPSSPQQNGIANCCIGLIMELNLWPRVSEPETSPTLRWTGKVGDASMFRVRGALSLVRDAKASKLSSRTLRCVFLGFPTDAPPWQFYHPRERRVFSSQDVTFDESACYYKLHPHASHPVCLM